MKSPKRQPAGCDGDILAQLRDVPSMPEVRAARELHQHLLATAKRLERALVECRDIPSSGGEPVASVEADVETLLATGGDVDALAQQPSRETQRQLITRQLHAARRAADAAEQRAEQAKLRACQRELERLEPLLANEYTNVLTACENLLTALQRWQTILTSLGQHGLSGLSVATYALTPLEDRLLHSRNVGENLAEFVAMRRRALGLADDD